MAGWRIGYCTSGFSSHRLEDAITILADLGYRGVFLTLDVHHLDPFAPDLSERVPRVAAQLARHDMAVVVETGARFLLDPRRKHLPSLLSEDDGGRRLDLLQRAVDVARDLGATCVSAWSGTNPDDLPEDACWERLTLAFTDLLQRAADRGVTLALEPEPGMFIETVGGYLDLRARLGAPSGFGLSLDVGHLLVTGEGEPADVILAHRDHLLAVAIEDMRRGRHEHLPFGEGDLDLAATIRALDASGFAGVVAVELARHGHEAVRQAERSRHALRALGVRFAEPGGAP